MSSSEGRPGARRSLTPAVALLALAAPAWGQSAAGWNPQDLAAIAGQSRALREAGQDDPALAKIAAAGEQAMRQALPAQDPRAVGTAATAPSLPAATRPLLLFVSASMGEASLREAMAAAAEDGAVTIVWRGLAPRETLRDAVQRLARLVRGLQPVPTQTIDPPAFGRHRVEAVPTLVDPQSGSQLRGTTNATAMRQRLAEAEARPNSPPLDAALGPTAVVAEADLVEMIRTRLAGLDLTAEMRHSAARWWERQRFTELPPAPRDQTRTVDPSLYLQADLRGPDGGVLALAGRRVNPLDQVPFRSVLLVFDPRDARQVAWARRQAAAAQPVILMATVMDRQAGWDGHAALVTRLGHPVFLLSPVLRDRLGVAVVPSRITAAGGQLRIEEFMAAGLPPAGDTYDGR